MHASNLEIRPGKVGKNPCFRFNKGGKYDIWNLWWGGGAVKTVDLRSEYRPLTFSQRDSIHYKDLFIFLFPPRGLKALLPPIGRAT
jgi:hypothetical protein